MPRHRRIPSDRPLAWLFWLLSLLFRLLFTTAFGLRFNKPEAIRRLRGPLVVIGNHPSYFDPFLTAAALFPWRINYVTSHGFFRNPVLRFLLGKLGAIPKIQFRSDMQAMKHMLRVIRTGGILGIYPEGQRSLDGGRQTVDEAIAKLVSKLGCPVVAVHDSGGYLTWPRWSQSRWRRGRIQVEISLLFTPQQLAGLDVGAIQERIESALDYQDYAWQRRKPHVFHSRAPAAGLHVLCHKCPACGRDLAMQSSRFHMACRYCGNRARMDRYGFLHADGCAGGSADQPAGPAQNGRKPADSPMSADSPMPRVWSDPYAWHQWQLADMGRRLRQPDFQLAFAARAEIIADDGTIVPLGRGQLGINSESLWFAGDPAADAAADPAADPAPAPAQAPVRLDCPIRGKTGISADYGLQFEIHLADSSYRFILEEGQAVVMIADAIQVIQAAKAKSFASGESAKELLDNPVPDRR